MSSHLSQEDFILAYYRELDADAHLAQCDACRDELARLARVLDHVTPTEIPEPDAGYEARVWDRVSWRLRGAGTGALGGPKDAGRGRPALHQLHRWLAAAAVFALAFVAGLLVNRRDTATAPAIAHNQPSPVAPASSGSTQQQRDRILLVVVGDHFDSSERVLVELTNLTPEGNTDMSAPRARAEELLASNRLYRSAALDRGEESVATLLDELEPVLMQLAHAPDAMPAEELRRIQKRVEAKGLVFKLRVVRADVRATAAPHLQQPSI